MTNLDRRVLLGIAGLAGAALAGQAATAGSLDPPPGAVAPTGKTTDQIEPRIDLLNAPAAANVTSNSTTHYIINNPGSYYLSGNLTVSKTTGILILAPSVTLDLCGFEISGSATSSGVVVALSANCATVRNGKLSGLGNGVNAHNAYACTFSRLTATACQYVGLGLSSNGLAELCEAFSNFSDGIAVDPSFTLGGQSCVVTDCVAAGNGGYAFCVNSGSTLTRCVVSKNSGNYSIYTNDNCILTDCDASLSGTPTFGINTAIQVGENCTLTRCSAIHNYATNGIWLHRGCIATECIANANIGPGSGTFSAGFVLSDDTVVLRACTAAFNASAASPQTAQTGVGIYCDGSNFQVVDCAANNNAGDGILAGSATSGAVAQCRIERCEVNQNAFDGIRIIGSDATVAANRCIKNGGSGVHVQSGSSNILERNQLLGNTGNGVQVDSAVALVFGNQARGNAGGNYAIAAGNRVGTLVVPATNAAAISGNSGGTAFTTDPYANIAF